MLRTIGIFVYPGHQVLDMAGPMAVFQTANRLSTSDVYSLRTISAYGGRIENGAGLVIETAPAAGLCLDTLVVAGGGDRRQDGPVVAAVRDAARIARRVTSVCTGTFLLAAAGLLHGRRATTHWRHTVELQRTHPDARVVPDAIYLRDGPVWTSGGITAGIDLALALLTDDRGDHVAQRVARELLVYYRRPGGQSQFSAMADMKPTTDRIARALDHARSHLHESLTIERLAEIAYLGPRQFARAFKRETGETPARAVERLRAEAARERLAQDRAPIASIAAAVGFGNSERLRRACLRRFGEAPQTIRRQARAARIG